MVQQHITKRDICNVRRLSDSQTSLADTIQTFGFWKVVYKKGGPVREMVGGMRSASIPDPREGRCRRNLPAQK
jgi:hypothetical protein